MKSDKILFAADLMCGAGGMSTGLMQAAKQVGANVKLLALNHWAIAIETHTKNHSGAQHYCKRLDQVSPREAVPGGRLHILCASPECTHHSNARGGKPMSDQSRSSAWDILKWAEQLYVDNIIIENVREFRDWGPLKANGRPVESQKGALYQQFLRSLRALGYTVSDRVLNSAHYGGATTRQRLFIQAVKGHRAVTWPDATHVESPGSDLFDLPKWRAARGIIDWSLPSQSIYKRKKPLSPNTMRRIIAGLRKYSGLPFVVGAGGPTGSGRPQSVDGPLGVVLTDDHRALVEPFLVVLRNNQDASGMNDPVPTLTTSGANFALCEPFLVSAGGPQVDAIPVSRPANTVLTRDHMALCQPFVIPLTHTGQHERGHSVDEPLPTVTCAHRGELGVVEPFLVPYYTERDGQAPRVLSVDDPLDTLSTENRLGLAQPFLVKFYGKGGDQAIDEPLHTLSTKDHFGLVEPQATLAYLDIKFRMLQPHELQAAMGFPPDYQFAGNRGDKVKQIGNAVECNTARALNLCVMERLGYCA